MEFSAVVLSEELLAEEEMKKISLHSTKKWLFI